MLAGINWGRQRIASFILCVLCFRSQVLLDSRDSGSGWDSPSCSSAVGNVMEASGGRRLGPLAPAGLDTLWRIV